MAEEWSWWLWLKGHFSIKRYGKDIGTLIRFAIIAVVAITLIYGVVSLKRMLLPKQHETTQKNVDKSKIESNNGTINQSDNHATETVIHNHSPLENGLLGLIFGSKDQTIKEENV